MKKLLLSLLCISQLLVALTVDRPADLNKAFYYPQIAGQGNTGLAFFGNDLAADLNPALLAKYKGWSFNWIGAQLFNSLQYNKATLGASFFDTAFSLSFMNESMGGIPVTEYIDDRIRQNGSFYESMTQIRLTAARKLNDLWIFRDLDFGYSAGLQRYTFNTDQDYYAKAGLLSSTYLLKNVYAGMTVDDQGELSYGVSLVDEPLQIFTDYRSGMVNSGIRYSFNDMLSMSGGIDQNYFTFGSGIFYERLYGPLNMNLALGLDVAYLYPRDDIMRESLFYAGITIRELERLQAPVIYKYPKFTNQTQIRLSGWAPRNSDVWLYVDEQLMVKTDANGNGGWTADVSITGKKTIIKAKTVKSSGRKESNFSKPAVIQLDNTPPQGFYRGVVQGSQCSLTIKSDEALAEDPEILSDRKRITIPLYRRTYQTTLNLQSLSQPFSLKMVDLATNRMVYRNVAPFIRELNPVKQKLMTYKSQYMFSGQLNPEQALTAENKANRYRSLVRMNKHGHFQHIVPLKTGTNPIVLQVSGNMGTMDYPFRIIKLHQFKDIQNTDFDKLATIGVIDAVKYFHPNRQVTQAEALIWLIRFKEIKIDNSLEAAYDYALRNRWILIEDRFKLMTRREMIALLVKILSIDVSETSRDRSYFKNIKDPYVKIVNYFVEHGFIPIGEPYDPDVFITKKEFIHWLTRTDQLRILYHHYF